MTRIKVQKEESQGRSHRASDRTGARVRQQKEPKEEAEGQGAPKGHHLHRQETRHAMACSMQLHAFNVLSSQ